jgi:hypothetical protein
VRQGKGPVLTEVYEYFSECDSQATSNYWRAGSVAQVVEHLPSKYKALISNNTTVGERERERVIGDAS